MLSPVAYIISIAYRLPHGYDASVVGHERLIVNSEKPNNQALKP